MLLDSGDLAQDHLLSKRRDNGSNRAVVLSVCTHLLFVVPVGLIGHHLTQTSEVAFEINIVPEQSPAPVTPPSANPPLPPVLPAPQTAAHPVHRHAQPKVPPSIPAAASSPVGESGDVADAATLLADRVAPPSAATSSHDRQADADLYKALVWTQIQTHRPDHVRVAGRTVILFTVALNGNLQMVRVLTPSGNDRLDQVALDVVRNAAPFPPPPSTSTAEDLTFSIPFDFH